MPRVHCTIISFVHNTFFSKMEPYVHMAFTVTEPPDMCFQYITSTWIQYIKQLFQSTQGSEVCCSVMLIVLFHNYFSPSVEQSEQCVLAHKSEQPTAGCIAIFHKYRCYIKHYIITNLTLWNPLGYNTDMSKYHVIGTWIEIYYVLFSKTYCTSVNLF